MLGRHIILRARGATWQAALRHATPCAGAAQAVTPRAGSGPCVLVAAAGVDMKRQESNSKMHARGMAGIVASNTRALPRRGLLDRLRLGTSITGEYGLISDRYEVGRELGSGRFGVVYEGTSLETGEKFAIKTILKKNIYDKHTLENEVAILGQLDGRKTMHLVETLEDRHNLHIVSDLYTGGELFDRIIDMGDDSFTEYRASEIMRQALHAVKYLHDNNISHRDLKPENIMFRDSEPDSSLVLVDFGMAIKFHEGTKMNTQVGSPSYVAPEVLKGSYTEVADLWSLGVIMYILLSGEPPFYGDTPSQIMRKVREGVYSMDQQSWRFVSEQGKDLVQKLMDPDPVTRITLEEALAHPWWSVAAYSTDPLSPTLLDSIRSFEGHNKLKRAAIGIIARGMHNAPELENVRAIFETFDENQDGVMTTDELGHALKEAGAVTNAQSLAAITKNLDADRDGTITLSEFMAAAADKSLYTETDRLRQAFSVSLPFARNCVLRPLCLLRHVGFCTAITIVPSRFSALRSTTNPKIPSTLTWMATER